MARELHVGDLVGPLEKPPITKTQLVMYSGASGDFNPIHTVDEFAVKVGLGGVIAHGMLTMAFVGQMLTEFVGFDGTLQEFGVRFVNMVRPGDVIKCFGKVQKVEQAGDQQLVELEVWAENQNGVHVVEGNAVASFA
jgi:acyl dehydratase